MKTADPLTETDNPCLSCTVNQDCCTRLTGLTVTEKEYHRCFARHEGRVEVTRQGSLYLINANHAKACPNWREAGGCEIYAERPAECRLFPHNSYEAQKGVADSRLRLRIHEVSTCPLRKRLRLPASSAIELVRCLAEEAYGEDREIEVQMENPLEAGRRKASELTKKLVRGWRKLIRWTIRGRNTFMGR